MKKQKDISQEYLKAIGANIKVKRKEKALTLEELGEKMGLDKKKAHRIEGGYNITLVTLLKLIIALDVDPAELLRFDRKLTEKDLKKLVMHNKASKLKKKKE